ncbi:MULTISPECIES: S9 family peptidase [unclassified Arcicella]|uniref:S9 family peptidase n=1 Tax=unclassified Arcicella TaxID=2644986 RepID=UPI002861429F|nr:MULTISPECIES: S9 family peptidase [unclassified Arcicella]MDR6560812.1 oligopeptidase B [Arcicella sp. BE51]MDR6810696.1 oligopeptidase B [Arcicella sp. BE140]MDR6822046.1 oligopeptidase B [Arcicella sp. BE139]
MNPDVMQAPVAAIKPHPMTLHGDTRQDNYYWLNEPENPEVIEYLNAENSYTDAVMAPTKPLQEALFNEMKGRVKENDESVPVKDGNYYYYSRYIEGGEYPLYCRKKGSLDAEEQIMLDGNIMAEGLSYFSIGGYEISDNEQILAYGIDTVSRRNYTLKFKDLTTGEILADEIPNTEGGAYAWATDNKTIFYMVRDQQTLLASKVYRHEIGTPIASDVLVYTEEDAQFYMGLGRMKSKKYIISVSEQNGVSTEYRLLEASNPTGQFVPFYPREEGLEYSIEHFEDKFYIRTNVDDAINFKLMEVSEGQSAGITNWKEVVPHREDTYLDGMEVFKNHLVLQERRNALIHIRIINQATQAEHYIQFNETAYDAGVSSNPDFETNILRYSYTSLSTPSSVYDYDMDHQTQTLMKEQTVLGDFDKDDYVSERLYATARDGIKIPISIVYKKGFKRDGSQPLLQYAYGSYGYSIDPYFSAARLSLLNRGFAFAIAHIRGGQEMGRQWYEDGKLLKKLNTFNDFIDVSEYLIAEQWTSKDKLFANGGSAGGLLMGAVTNMRPDLYKGILAAVPFVDVVTTMLDESIPLTTGEWEEWGNPKQKEYYDYMKSYSPVDNVEAKDYPNMLVTTGLHDSQVQYFEPAKWVAKLRALKTNNNLLLMHTDMEAGHGGASGRFKRFHDIALEYAFMLNLMGIYA